MSRSSLLDPREAQLVHFHRQLEQIVQTLTLSLRFGNVVAPYVTATIVSDRVFDREQDGSNPYIP